MLRLHYRFRNFCCAALLVFFGIFSAFVAMQQHLRVYAESNEEPTLRQADTSEFFVTIHDNGSTLMVKTGAVTVAEVLEKSEIDLAETDMVEPGLDTVIDGDYNINIYRARPALIIDGIHRRYVMTASYDPKQIAIEAGLTVYDDDEVAAEFNNNFLEAGAVSTYRITRSGGRTLTLEETIPYSTEVRYDYNRPRGERVLEQPGEEGRKVSVYEVEFDNNIEVSRTLVSESIVVEPVPEIVIEGAKASIPPEREQCAAWAREAGVAEEDLETALDLIYRESGCRVDATNSGSGAYGIPQALPRTKLLDPNQGGGPDGETNPVTQIRWMINYVNYRYGGWSEALAYWWCTGACTSRLGTTEKHGTWY